MTDREETERRWRRRQKPYYQPTPHMWNIALGVAIVFILAALLDLAYITFQWLKLLFG